jgi:uncharacterized protein involved in exopolysaccharide biosynthesis
MRAVVNRILGWLRTREARRVAATTVAGVLVAVVYAFSAPNWYQSTLTVMPASAKGGGVSSQLAGALGGALDFTDVGVNADVERIAAVLQSRSVTDAVIRKLDLMKRYRAAYVEHARQALWSHCFTQIDRKARLVSLTCEDQEPQFVQRLVEYFGEHGNEVFLRVGTSSASEEVRFLEQRVVEMRKEADDSARRLRDFEERFKIIDLDSQSRAVVSAMASLRSQEISKELELSYMNTYSSRDEATAVTLRQQLALMNSKFRKLEEAPSAPREADAAAPAKFETKPTAAKEADLFPAAMTVPLLRYELGQLYRDRNIRETDLLLLMQRLEMAKVNEARDTSAFQILDHPEVPTFKSRPRRRDTVATGLALGLVAGLAWAFGRSYLRSLVEPGSPKGTA